MIDCRRCEYLRAVKRSMRPRNVHKRRKIHMDNFCTKYGRIVFKRANSETLQPCRGCQGGKFTKGAK